MEMIGYWEADPAVSLSWSGPDRGAATAIGPNATCRWNETKGKYISGASGAADDIGFGTACGPPRPFDYPAMTVAQIQQKCCELGDGCVAFSWSAKQDPASPGTACARKSWGNGGYSKSADFNGYEKIGIPRPSPPPGPPPPPPPGVCEQGSILASTYVDYQVRAVVVVSSWCPSPKQVAVHLDWATLGMKEGAVSISQPAIAGVQPAKDLGGGSAPVVMVSGAANGGFILVVTPK